MWWAYTFIELLENIYNNWKYNAHLFGFCPIYDTLYNKIAIYFYFKINMVKIGKIHAVSNIFIVLFVTKNLIIMIETRAARLFYKQT